jgi:hypothetical protein
MKKLFVSILLIASTISIAQSKIATTEDGKRVLLRDNNTWEYIDSNPSKSVKQSSSNRCNLSADYTEPKPDKKVQSWLKRGDATIDDLRKHISVENDCQVSDVIFLSISEQMGNGMYSVCVKGKEMKYRRMGTVFSRLDEELFKGN